MDEKQGGESNNDSESKASHITGSDNDATSQKTQSVNSDPQRKIEKLETTIKIDQWIMIGLTAAIALAGILQWRTLTGQLGEMHTTGIDTHDLAVAAGKQADAAKKQSEQAKAQTNRMKDSLERTDRLIKSTNDLAAQARRQADITREALITVQRAFVNLKTLNAIHFANVQEWEVSSQWGNDGTTPAKSALGYLQFQGDANLTEEKLTFRDVDENMSRFFIGPRGVEVIGKGRIQDEVISRLQAKKIRLYAYGWVTYRDTFKGTPEHMTMFCSEILGFRTVNNIAQGDTVACSRHNCTDEECSGEPYGKNAKKWK